MNLDDLKMLADDENVEEPIIATLGKITQRTAKTSGKIFYTGQLTDPEIQARVNVTFFTPAARDLSMKTIEIAPVASPRGAMGVVKSSYNGHAQLTVFDKAEINVVEGGTFAAAPPAEELPSNMETVPNQVNGNSSAFDSKMKQMGRFYLHCLRLSVGIKETMKKHGVELESGHCQAMTSTFFINGQQEGLDIIAPAFKFHDVPQEAAKQPVSDPEPEPEPEPTPEPPAKPEPSYHEQKKAETAAAQQQMKEIEDMDEDEVPF